jgi:DDHD domain
MNLSSLCNLGLYFILLKGRGQDYWQDEKIQEEMPCCRQMFNIFHPFDPVAYRYKYSLVSKSNTGPQLHKYKK